MMSDIIFFLYNGHLIHSLGCSMFISLTACSEVTLAAGRLGKKTSAFTFILQVIKISFQIQETSFLLVTSVYLYARSFVDCSHKYIIFITFLVNL